MADSNPYCDSPLTKRWQFRFSVRAMLGLTALVALVCSWFAIPTSRANHLASSLKEDNRSVAELLSWDPVQASVYAPTSGMPVKDATVEVTKPTRRQSWRGERTVEVRVPIAGRRGVIYITFRVTAFETKLEGAEGLLNGGWAYALFPGDRASRTSHNHESASDRRARNGQVRSSTDAGASRE